MCGQCAAIMRFKGHTKEHTVTTQVIDNTRMTPIMGIDFWKPHNVVFDLKNNHITIEIEEEGGSVTQEVIRCWCQDAKSETEAAVLIDHLSEVQEAQQWSQQNIHQVSAVQVASIQNGESELQKQIADIEQLMSSKNVTTSCRATEDMLIPPGHRERQAVTATVDMPADQLHCTMVFEVNGIKAVADIDHEEEEDTPELLSESESEIDSESDSEEDSNSELGEENDKRIFVLNCIHLF